MAVYTSSQKNMIKVFIMNALYSDVHSKNSKELENIFSEHKLRVPESLGGFWFKTRIWCKSNKPYTAKPLHEDLTSRMLAYEAQYLEIHKESQYVESYLTFLMSEFKLEQLYGFLPPSLHQVLVSQNVENYHYEATKDDYSLINRFNQRGYDLLLERILMNTIGG